ncbi:sensor histidine kinase [Pseudoalteromonas tunicata]|uniref:sensor histidine kinase n=1 Tax=Pseudoalteromonas tunicata TaxID=314281 RepID=UPI00273D0AD5|nr:sensor histidine kinase [Pseudoalteromonas tunicata]MDP5212296.1 sensor histidine kinase [Pseudoalteromonas tunicata]
MKNNDKLQQKMSWIYLGNLIFFFAPLFFVTFTPWQWLVMGGGLSAFLYCYFWAYRCTLEQMALPIIGIVVVASALTPINPGTISMFAYAGFFIGFAYSLRRYLTLMVALVALIFALNHLFTVAWTEFLTFGIPIILGVSALGWVEQARLKQRLAQQQSEDEIKQLAAMVERERIARDLHDILGHTLSSIVLKANLANKLLGHNQVEGAQQQLQELSDIARAALSQVRHSVSGYKHLGLTAEVAKLFNLLRDAGFSSELVGEVPSLQPRQETTLILVLTELVTNVIRHSKGDVCQLHFSRSNKEFQIRFNDNGQISSINEGNGVTGMRERLAAIGGQLVLTQQNGFCATITLTLQE